MRTESDALMTIIDTLKFRNILVDGKIAEEEPAQQFVTALDEAFEEQLEGVATKEFVRAESTELAAEMQAMRAEMQAMRSDILQSMAEMEARLRRQMQASVGIIVAAVAAAATLLAVFG